MNIDDSIRDGLAAAATGDDATAADRDAVEQRARGLRRQRTAGRLAAAVVIVLVIGGLAIRRPITTVDTIPADERDRSSSVSTVADPAVVGTAVPGTTASSRPPERLPLEPFRAEAADPTCRLVPGRTDFTDLPRSDDGAAGTEAYGGYGAKVAPAPGSVDAHSPRVTDNSTMDRTSSAFLVQNAAVAFYDPATARPTAVVRFSGGCQLQSAAGTADALAATACTGQGADGYPNCHLVVRVGGQNRAWTFASKMYRPTWSGGHVIVTGEYWIGRFDPLTGEGTATRSSPACPYPQFAPIQPTNFAVRTCVGADLAERADVIDVATGEVVADDFPAKTARLHSDGEVIWGLDQPRRNAETFAVTGPSALSPRAAALAVMFAPDGNGTPGLVDALEVPGGIWLVRCAGPCVGGDGSVELAFVDGATGVVTDRWSATNTLVSREQHPSGIKLRSADATGAWYTVNDRLYRLNRPAG